VTILSWPDNEADFRRAIRQWIEDNCPLSMRGPNRGLEDICWGGRRWTFASDDQRLWLERAAAAGLTVPGWPCEYGGAGLTPWQQRIFDEEMTALEARSPLESFGIWMLGPALLKFGTEEQKRIHLPPIARGEIRWCQGYSEPEAGSDLASLKTRAEDHGDHFIVNGQKIWTSYADEADWIFFLARTDPSAPKHRGISFLLADMDSAGISTRPIRLISGKSPFCETFFDNVRVPKENLVGAVNDGWTVAKYLLAHEREMIGGGARGLQDSLPLHRVVQEFVRPGHDPFADADLRQRIARAEIDALALAQTVDRYLEMAQGGEGVGDKSSVIKYCAAEQNKRRQSLILEAAGIDGLAWDTTRADGSSLARNWLRAKANSIEGGTAEIMLGIIAQRLLDLPRG